MICWRSIHGITQAQAADWSVCVAGLILYRERVYDFARSGMFSFVHPFGAPSTVSVHCIYVTGFSHLIPFNTSEICTEVDKPKISTGIKNHVLYIDLV